MAPYLCGIKPELLARFYRGSGFRLLPSPASRQAGTIRPRFFPEAAIGGFPQENEDHRRCGGDRDERPRNLAEREGAQQGISAVHGENPSGMHAEPGPEEIGPEGKRKSFHQQKG